VSRIGTVLERGRGGKRNRKAIKVGLTLAGDNGGVRLREVTRREGGNEYKGESETGAAGEIFDYFIWNGSLDSGERARKRGERLQEEGIASRGVGESAPALSLVWVGRTSLKGECLSRRKLWRKRRGKILRI